jgi:hypothetical protein
MAKTIKLRRSLGFQNPRDEQLNNGKGEEPKKRRSNKGEQPKKKRSRLTTESLSEESDGNKSLVHIGGKLLSIARNIQAANTKAAKSMRSNGEEDSEDSSSGSSSDSSSILSLAINIRNNIEASKNQAAASTRDDEEDSEDSSSGSSSDSSATDDSDGSSMTRRDINVAKKKKKTSHDNDDDDNDDDNEEDNEDSKNENDDDDDDNSRCEIQYSCDENDNEDKDSDIEEDCLEGEETNEISLKIVLSCLALPGLALRKKHYDEEGDGASCDSITPENFPETMSCDFNARKVKLQRLGFNCSKSHGSRDILQELRKEKSNATLSVMNGNIILVLTSFREGDVTKKRDKYRMNSILRASEPDTGAESTGAESIVAIPLTEKILEDALRWLKGNTDTGEDSLANGQTERTLEELVTAYLDSLSKAIPAKSDCKTLMDFIRTHDWPDRSLEEMLEELKKKGHDENIMEKSYFLRGFIHQNLARKTKVVAHFVDGNHRAAALNCAWIGSGDDVEAKNEYYENFPHNEKKVETTILVPIKLTNVFHEKMRNLSFSSQRSVGKITKHGKKEFITRMIDSLHIQLKQSSEKYYLFRKKREIKTEDDIHEHIQMVAAKILELFRSLREEEMMNQDSDYKFAELKKIKDLDWSILFKKKKKKRKENTEEYADKFWYHCDNAENVIPTIIRRLGNIESEKRYQRSPFNAHVFELAQLLLWSTLSKSTHHQLLGWISHNDPTAIQICANDNSGGKTTRWISAMINLVTCSVYYSFKFKKINNEELTKNMNEILPKLIMRKIKETTQFLTYFGQDPVPPDWGQELEVAIKNYPIEEKIKDVYKGANQKLIKRMSDSFTIPKDFITFFTVAFAYHIIQTSKVISLQDYYNEEASKTVLDEIVEKYLRNVVCVEFGKKLGKANFSFQEPSPDECKGIIQIVDTFKSTTIESLINKMKHSGTEQMKKKAQKLAEKISSLSTVSIKQRQLLVECLEVPYQAEM